MLNVLHQCSLEHINQAFKPLEEFDDYIFWIRSHDMSRQFYTSPNFDKIWQRDLNVVFELPLLWLDYLKKDNDNTYMRKFQVRHEDYYLNQDKNFLTYQIITPKNEIRYLVDRCFRCQSMSGDHYIIGISINVRENQWDETGDRFREALNPDTSIQIQRFFLILEKEFGIKPLDQKQANAFLRKMHNNSLEGLQGFHLSKRELECLYHFCQGRTYKEIAKLLLISPRTVETHLEKLLYKTSCSNKLDMICRFSRYFVDKE